jgi:hypothetical protein
MTTLKETAQRARMAELRRIYVSGNSNRKLFEHGLTACLEDNKGLTALLRGSVFSPSFQQWVLLQSGLPPERHSKTSLAEFKAAWLAVTRAKSDQLREDGFYDDLSVDYSLRNGGY